MAEKEPKGISLMWKTEDWLAVWVGFLIILLILAGLAVKTPKFKWTTDGEFTTYVAKVGPSIDPLAKKAAELTAKAAGVKAAVAKPVKSVKKRKAVKEQMPAEASAAAAFVAAARGMEEKIAVAKAAVEGKDRKAIGAAAGAVEGAAKAYDEKGDALIAGLAGKDVALEALAKAAVDKGSSKKTAKLFGDVKKEAGSLVGKVYSGENILLAVYIGIAYLVLSLIALALLGQKAAKLIAGFPAVFILAWIAQLIAGNHTVSYYGIEYVLWCLFLGLFISNVIGTPEWLKPAVQTEFYIKSGLVVLGSGILFGEIVQAGFYGIVQALLVVGAVWYFTFWVAKKMKVDEEFAVVLSSAVSICGVSAAIATGGAIKADPKKISYTTSIVLICAIPMLILQPLIAKWFGMSDLVAGAWLGGTLDTSGSVVAAGELISPAAMKTGVIVKMSQNVLIGVAAFILSVVWTLKACKVSGNQQTPSAMEIWHRFPKFVLGFIIASLAFSFLVSPETVSATKGALGGLRTWWFALAFTCIGLETKFSDLAKMEGGRPAIAFLIGQTFNIFWTLILAWLLFGGVIFPVPNIK